MYLSAFQSPTITLNPLSFLVIFSADKKNPPKKTPQKKQHFLHQCLILYIMTPSLKIWITGPNLVQHDGLKTPQGSFWTSNLVYVNPTSPSPSAAGASRLSWLQMLADVVYTFRRVHHIPKFADRLRCPQETAVTVHYLKWVALRH